MPNGTYGGEGWKGAQANAHAPLPTRFAYQQPRGRWFAHRVGLRRLTQLNPCFVLAAPGIGLRLGRDQARLASALDLHQWFVLSALGCYRIGTMCGAAITIWINWAAPHQWSSKLAIEFGLHQFFRWIIDWLCPKSATSNKFDCIRFARFFPAIAPVLLFPSQSYGQPFSARLYKLLQ